MGSPRDGNRRGAVEEVEKRIKWRRVFAESLTRIERKGRDGPVRILGQNPTHDGAILILHEVREISRRIDCAGFRQRVNLIGLRNGPPVQRPHRLQNVQKWRRGAPEG